MLAILQDCLVCLIENNNLNTTDIAWNNFNIFIYLFPFQPARLGKYDDGTIY